MGRKLNVALIGCGSVGRGVHLPILKKNSRVRVVAVVDTSDVTLADTETVDVTYTFDISSAGT